MRFFVDCYIDACVLVCRDTGPWECTWSNGLQNGCLHCINDYENCKAQEMFDYVYNKIENDINSGTYSLNYTDTENNINYNRTITWSYDSGTSIHHINSDVTEIK